ncbi:hypothetical protein [Pseudonocardia sp. NPDC049154]|uniref:hypothetical protein n=1 Tax=Pseudonocardia sp. NPDC049154 TaxID=3155501 RepID=UPI0033FC922F
MTPLDEFRAEVRAWLPANLDRRGTATPDPHTPGHVAEHRARLSSWVTVTRSFPAAPNSGQ